MLRKQLRVSPLTVWTYCLMPNHVHFVAVPSEENGLAKLFRPLHAAYAKRINREHGWQGHMWQERFYSVVMDETHALAAMRYVEQNPVRAGLCDRPEYWRWSSARSNMGIVDDGIVDIAATANVVGDWRSYLAAENSEGVQASLRKHTRIGRPVGDTAFLKSLESKTGKKILRQKISPAEPRKRSLSP